MTEASRAVLPHGTWNGLVIDAEIQKAFEENPAARENFQEFPSPRVRIDCIRRGKKRNHAVFEKRLQKLIDQLQKEKMFGERNDCGQLSDDD